jgi:hypothetical protein
MRHNSLDPMKMIPLFLAAAVLMSLTPLSITAQTPATPAELRRLADDYYRWRNENYPVFSSDSGLHTWDSKLTNYSLSSVLSRRLYVKNLLATINNMQTSGWAKNDRIDWLLFRSQLEAITFFDRVMDSEATNPQT